jgi:hypothetical protein
MDPEGSNMCTDSQHWTSQFTVTKSTSTVSGLKAKIAELQKQLAVIEVDILRVDLQHILYPLNQFTEYR